MPTKSHQIEVSVILNLILAVILYVTVPVNGLDSRKLDETTVPSPKGDEKCTPCGYSSPPPPLANPPPSPPPPSPKKPPSTYCPPPPPTSFIYITGPPTGNLYPVDENFNGATGRQSFATALPPLVGLLSLLLAFW